MGWEFHFTSSLPIHPPTQHQPTILPALCHFGCTSLPLLNPAFPATAVSFAQGEMDAPWCTAKILVGFMHAVTSPFDTIDHELCGIEPCYSSVDTPPHTL